MLYPVVITAPGYTNYLTSLQWEILSPFVRLTRIFQRLCAKYAVVDSICQCNTPFELSLSGVLNFSVFLGLFLAEQQPRI